MSWPLHRALLSMPLDVSIPPTCTPTPPHLTLPLPQPPQSKPQSCHTYNKTLILSRIANEPISLLKVWEGKMSVFYQDVIPAPLKYDPYKINDNTLYACWRRHKKCHPLCWGFLFLPSALTPLKYVCFRFCHPALMVSSMEDIKVIYCDKSWRIVSYGGNSIHSFVKHILRCPSLEKAQLWINNHRRPANNDCAVQEIMMNSKLFF